MSASLAQRHTDFLRQRADRLQEARQGRPRFAVHAGGGRRTLPVRSYEATVLLAHEAVAAVMQGTPEEQARIEALLREISAERV